MSLGPTVADVGEAGLLRLIQGFCDLGVCDLGVGDDAAVLPLPEGDRLVVSSDVLVDGVHFASGWAGRSPTMSPHAVGWRSAAANLSDLAAMGAKPLGLTVSLALPPGVLLAWVEQVYQGLVDCLAPWGAVILGGDCARAGEISLGVTALGSVAPNQVIRRGAAQVGDAIAVTGYHGSSRAGLECLLQGGEAQVKQTVDRLIHAHQYPQARLDVVPLLNEFSQVLAVQGRGIAGMDSSDGLADAVVQLAQASGLGVRLNRTHIPLHPQLAASCDAETALDWALYGGEDFELVLALPLGLAEVLCDRLGPPACVIGEMTAGSEVILVDPQGPSKGRSLSPIQGFQHF